MHAGLRATKPLAVGVFRMQAPAARGKRGELVCWSGQDEESMVATLQSVLPNGARKL